MDIGRLCNRNYFLYGNALMTPSEDAVKLAQIVEDYFNTLPIFGDRVITLREGCALHEEARKILKESRK